MDLMVSLLDTWAKLVKLAYTKELLEVTFMFNLSRFWREMIMRKWF